MIKYEVTMPEIFNIICPRCRLTWLNKIDNEPTYFCYACNYVMFERQIEEILKQENLK